MRDQLMHINDAILDQPDGSRPRIGIAILELQVDFLRAETHKGDRHVGFAHADNEDFAAEFDAVDGVSHGGFDSGAFEGDGGFDAVGGFDDFIGALGGLEGRVDFVRFGSRAESGGVFQAAFVDVGDDNGTGAGCLAAKKSDEADGPCAADEDAVTEGYTGAFHAGEGDAEGFE